MTLIINGELPKDEKYPLSCLYWIHTPEMTDPKTQGYIGVSSVGYKTRWSEHKSKARKGGSLVIHNAIRKYPDIKITELFKASPEFCSMAESMYRPSPCIAWNISMGGLVSPMQGRIHNEAVRKTLSDNGKKRMQDPAIREALSLAVKGFKHSDSAKEKIRMSSTGRLHSEESKALMSLRQKQSYVVKDSWLVPRSDPKMWAKSLLIYDFMQTKRRVGWKSTAQQFDTTESKVKTICQKIKDGWNPHEDMAFLKWLSNAEEQNES